MLTTGHIHPDLGENVFVGDGDYVIDFHIDVLKAYSPGKRAKVTRYDIH